MSVSVHVEAIIPVDGDKYRSMVAVRESCYRAGVAIPAAVSAFFGNDDGESCVDERGRRVEIPRSAQSGDVAYGDGQTIDLSQLPEGVTKLRIYMS